MNTDGKLRAPHLLLLQPPSPLQPCYIHSFCHPITRRYSAVSLKIHGSEIDNFQPHNVIYTLRIEAGDEIWAWRY